MTKPTYSQFKLKHCLACGSAWHLDVAHVLTRKAWPEYKNEIWNCATLCRDHHTEQGNVGIAEFAKRFPRYKVWLEKYGWYVCELTGKFRNPKMEKV